MEKNLQQLWKIMKFSLKNDILQQAKLLKIEFKKKNDTLYFTLQINKILPIEIIRELEQCLLKLDFRSKITFLCVDANYVIEQIVDYWEYIKQTKTKQKEYINSNISCDNLVLENNDLLIKVHNESQVALTNRHLKYYQERMRRYGFQNLSLKIKIEQYDVFVDPTMIQIEDEERMKVQQREQQQVKALNAKKRAFKGNLSSSDNLLSQVSCKISELEEDVCGVSIQGQIFRKDCKLTKTKRWIYSILISDFSDAIALRYFTSDDMKDKLLEELQEKDWVVVKGDVRFDNFSREQVLWVNKIQKIADPHLRTDDMVEKRIEFHLHTKMSAMDGVTSIGEYIKQAGLWKHSAIAITDHLNVQSFPDAQMAQKKYPAVKVIYGVEMQMIDSSVKAIINATSDAINACKFVIFDIETTGLSSRYDEIIEFGAVVIEGRGLSDKRYDFLIKPKSNVSAFSESLTGISNEMLQDKPPIEIVAAEIKEVLQDAVLVAHNASFDIGFIQELWNKMGYGKLTNPIIDTLQLSRLLQQQLRYHRLGMVARKYNIKYNEEIAHRADYDAEILADVFAVMLTDLEDNYQVKTLLDIEKINYEPIFAKLFGNHTTVIAKNEQGLKDLFLLVSLSHTKYFYSSPKITIAALQEMRANVFIGSGCVNGQVFEFARNRSQQELEAIMQFYDYIEVQPLSVYNHLVESGEMTVEHLMWIVKNIVHTAKKLNKVVIASSDVHYLNPQDKIFRDVYINTKGLGGRMHPLFDRKGRVKNNPEQHLRTTAEMLNEFSFLEDEVLIKELVVTSPNYLNEQISWLRPIKDDLYTPVIDNGDVDSNLKRLCYDNAKKIYGAVLPIMVEERLSRELDAILKHGFGVVYWIAHLLVTRSLNDGYLVGSRGSVGSSLVATMAKITEVNPLVPHYVCSQCQYSEFISDENIRSGYDLPSKNCPQCRHLLTGDGHDIPFETFLGFDGDKVPDIDLNFSGEYQMVAHNFTKEMFGVDNVFRAGTISTVAQKTAFGYARGYLEDVKGNHFVKKAYLEWLAQGCEGVKRTTGQHPGGIVVVPKNYDVNDFTPVNFPADDITSQWKTTHFDFHAIHDNLLKLDILGHVDPTALKMLHDLTGYDPQNILCNDAEVLSLFSSPEIMKITSSDINNEKTGAVGLPEFGTQFVRKMLEETNPTSFADLVQISGLSHGTDVWVNNAQTLITHQDLKLKDVIGCRDDIMTYLIHREIPSDTAFNIMETVRKGKGVTDEQQKIMISHNVPQWYIASCQKIKYMFPKAHATAYVLMALRIAWYKINYPHEYYATYFSTRCDVFDIKTIAKGRNAVLTKLTDILSRMDNGYNVVNKLTQKEKDLVPVLEVALEMYARKIEFIGINLEHSLATNFVVQEFAGVKKIVPPLSALDGLGSTVANSIVEARTERAIASLEDLQKRTSITKTHLKEFEEMGMLSGLDKFDQISLNFFE
ncbi:PolC-type DNA polymerase III [Spiroplasma endosymbiont of 'Nebria riversi']|uniref:PolC-type DNA polymerase III n=1 Tax=Spiroplasma endosymbiont of 'Nebria riversi' TaxID=2792084 RepID=UPI001C05729D|nr:PolC-type DNA polymerase III [Spiroplasma endosymbiont of 'Nebria riversi']